MIKKIMDFIEPMFITWIIFLAYIIASYIITVSSINVFDKCPEESTDMTAQSNKNFAVFTLVITTIMIVLLPILMFLTKSLDSPYALFYDSMFNRIISARILGVIGSLLMIMSVFFTVICTFVGVSTANSCQVIKAKSEEEVNDFMRNSNNINRMVSLVSVILIGFIIYMIKMGIYSFTGKSS